MKIPWVVILAAGLAALSLSIGLRWGADIAALVAGAVAVFYFTLNVLQGRSKDDAEASQLLQRAFSTSWVTYVAAALLWLGVIGIAIVPVVDAWLSEEFTVRVVDENRQPVDGARVDIQFGGEWRPVPLQHGEGTVTYYPGSAPSSLLVRARHDGVERLVTHRMNSEHRFGDLVIRLWSGQAMVSVTHFTATELAIEPFLRGELPADLRARFPRVRVLRNAVFETAQQALSIYDRQAPFYLGYSQADARGNRTHDTAVSPAGGGDRRLEPYTGAVPTPHLVRDITLPIDWDMSSDILGSRTDQPLAEGFIATFNGASYWEAGTELLPAADTDVRIRSLGSTGRSPVGAIRVRLERSIGRREIALLLDRATSLAAGAPGNDEVRRYLSYMLQQGVPAGVIGAAIELDPVLGCGDSNEPASIGLSLPPPQLRVTILKNTGTAPLNLSAIIMTVQARTAISRATATGPTEEIQMPLDQLEPGEAILIPRELFFRSGFTDAQIAAMNAPAGRDVLQFSLFARIPSPQDANTYPSLDGFYHRPRTLTLAGSQVRVSEQHPLFQSWDQQSPDYLAHHSAYLVGPSVREVHYVVNGVRIRARSDPHTTIVMTVSGGEASCPFVFARAESGGPFVNLGQVIRRRIGFAARGRDRVRVPAELRVLEIRELEDEVSYIDAVWLVVRSANGEQRYPAVDPRLHAEDGRYLVLRRGQRARLIFRNVPRVARGTTSLEVSGYYDRIPRRASRSLGRSRPW